jgi:hypothetical protein
MAEQARLVDAKQVAILFDVSERTIRRWKKAGHMPKPVKQINRKCYWRYQDLDGENFSRTEADKSGQDA